MREEEKIRTYEEALAFLGMKKSSGATMGLERVRTLARYAGDPQEKLRFVHVTGTNGKGSFCAYLRYILTEAGLTAGAFNSPWITHYTEQIHVGVSEISEKDLTEGAEEIRKLVLKMAEDGYEAPTEFEMLFVLALLHFVKTGCDIVILEVGMGGLTDATNIIPPPELCVFMPISMDHQKWLGNDLASIARMKAGIIKDCSGMAGRECAGMDGRGRSGLGRSGRGRSGRGQDTAPTAVLLAEQAEEAEEVLVHTAEENGASLFHVPKTQVLSADIGKQRFRMENSEYTICMAGPYQVRNAAAAAAAAGLLAKRGFPVTEAAIARGLYGTRWPGRFEVLRKEPYFIIDGAHNPDGIRALSECLDAYFPGRDIIFIAGVLADKEYVPMMERMAPYAKAAHTVRVPNSRALPAEDLAELFTGLGVRATAHGSLEEAVSAALSEASKDDVIVAFGSLYYIGRIRELLP